MPETLFDLDEQDAAEPRSVTLEGFALLHDLTEPVRRIGQVCPIRWHLDPESICETREQIESYRAAWDDTIAPSPIIVRVKVECVEVVT
jgi:hypothetical protein